MDDKRFNEIVEAANRKIKAAEQRLEAIKTDVLQEMLGKLNDEEAVQKEKEVEHMTDEDKRADDAFEEFRKSINSMFKNLSDCIDKIDDEMDESDFEDFEDEFEYEDEDDDDGGLIILNPDADISACGKDVSLIQVLFSRPGEDEAVEETRVEFDDDVNIFDVLLAMTDATARVFAKVTESLGEADVRAIAGKMNDMLIDETHRLGFARLYKNIND